jgi:hypothetical protein
MREMIGKQRDFLNSARTDIKKSEFDWDNVDEDFLFEAVQNWLGMDL